jgi:alkylation response protein AidB-like acyl-CoA dehydrogenase
MESMSREDAVSPLLEWLRAYASERINSITADERRCLPPHVVLDLGNRGVLGMLAPVEYGGLGFGHVQVARVLEQLGAIDATLCLFVGLNNYLGIRPIARYAVPEVKDELMPRLATGRELAAFALTEPGAGSNPRAMRSHATLEAPGRWRLYGTKSWIGAAQWAGVLNVFTREGNTHAIGGHIVRQGSPGLRQGPEAPTMGMRGMIQNTVYLEGVRTTKRDRLGDEGAGMTAAQDTMTHGRLAIGAMCIGGIERCAQIAMRYASRRQISTGMLLDNPTTLVKLSEMTAAATALRCLIYQLAAAADAGADVPVEGFAACKVAAPEFLWRAADDTMQLLGGRGYIDNTPIAQLLRDARILRIFEGPTETMSTFLGARLMGNSTGLTRLIGELLRAPALVPRLEEIARRVAAVSADLDGPLATGSILWGQMQAGRLATWLVLQAAIESGGHAVAASEAARALSWVRYQLDHELLCLEHGTPSRHSCLAAQGLSDVIASFRERIGEVEQTLPLMSYDTDPLLRPDVAQPVKVETQARGAGDLEGVVGAAAAGSPTAAD